MSSKKLEKKIEQIKQKLQVIGPMRPGSISKQYSVCGKSGCRCQDEKQPRKHGPYYQLSYVHKGKSTSQFIRPQFLAEVKKQLANYKRFRGLTDEWVHLSVEYARARLEELKQESK